MIDEKRLDALAALSAKWRELNGDPPAKEPAAVVAARAAMATPEVTAPVKGLDAAGKAIGLTDDELGVHMAAVQARHDDCAGLFRAGAVTDKIAAINALTLPGPHRDISVAEIVRYLALNNLVATLAKSDVPEAVALQALIATDGIGAVPTSDAEAYAQFTALLVAAGSAGAIPALAAYALLALADTSVPWWETAGFTSPIGTGDLEQMFAERGEALV